MGQGPHASDTCPHYRGYLCEEDREEEQAYISGLEGSGLRRVPQERPLPDIQTRWSSRTQVPTPQPNVTQAPIIPRPRPSGERAPLEIPWRDECTPSEQVEYN